MDLDARARQAAAALRSTTEGALAGDAPVLDASASPLRRRLVGVAAALALLVGGAGLAAVASGAGDPDEAVVAGEGGDLPRFVAGWLPDGMELDQAMDLPMEMPDDFEMPDFEVTLELYGEPGDEPFSSRDLAVFVARGEEIAEESMDEDEGEPVTVQGREGRYMEGDSLGFPGGAAVAWPHQDTVVAMVQSRSLDRAALLALAETVTIGDDLDAEAQPPEGLESVYDGDMGGGAFSMGLMGLPNPFAKGSMVGYADADDEDRGVSVITQTIDDGSLALLHWMNDPSRTRRQQVRGANGWLTVPVGEDADDWYAVVWVERPGVLVSVGGEGITEDEILQVAEDVREASDDEWQEMVDRLPGGAESLAEGELSGERWRFYAEPGDDMLCIAYKSRTSCAGGDPNGSSVFLQGPHGIEHTSRDDIAEASFVAGRVAGEVTRVVVEAGGSSHEAQLVEGGWFVAPFAGDLPMGAEVVAYAGDRELERVSADSSRTRECYSEGGSAGCSYGQEVPGDAEGFDGEGYDEECVQESDGSVSCSVSSSGRLEGSEEGYPPPEESGTSSHSSECYTEPDGSQVCRGMVTVEPSESGS